MMGMMGISTAGFSARAPLTARRLGRLALRPASAAATGGAVSWGAAGWVARIGNGLAATFSSAATEGSFAAILGDLRWVLAPPPREPTAGAVGSVEAKAARFSLGESAAAVPESGFLFFLRLFREREDRLTGPVVAASSPLFISGAVCSGTKSVERRTRATGWFVRPGASAAGRAAASATGIGRGIGSFRRPPRFTGTDFVMTLDLRLSSETTARSSACTSPALAASDWGNSSVKRSAFLRAVRLAPPRERRFFFLAGSS